MTEHDSEAVVRHFYEAFLQQDFDALSQVISEDAEWHVTGRSRLSGVHKGREAIFAFLRQFKELSGGTFKPFGPDTYDICTSEYHVVLMDRFIAKLNGKTLDSHEVVVVHFKDGQAKTFLHYFFDQYAFDDFWE